MIQISTIEIKCLNVDHDQFYEIHIIEMQKNAFEMQKTSLHSMTFQFHTLAPKQYFEFDGFKNTAKGHIIGFRNIPYANTCLDQVIRK